MARCKIGIILEDSDIRRDERTALLSALNDKELWPAKSLANAINNTRFSVGATTVKEHRRQNCGCFS